MEQTSLLFTPLRMKGLELKNRITRVPMYVGYGNPDGTVSDLLLDHYRLMAASGVSMVVVENAAVDFLGLGAPYMLRVDHDQYIPGLAKLAKTIQSEGAYALLQINHAGRFAFTAERLAPSALQIGDVIPREMSEADIERTVDAFAVAARRVKEAGFDGVEIHGGTGYLLAQFLSPRTNRRLDRYGGSLENRMRFPLRVVDAVFDAVGKDYFVGSRFMADEWLPELRLSFSLFKMLKRKYRFLSDELPGQALRTDETSIYARELEKKGIGYLSVMAGTLDCFFLLQYLEQEKKEAYMAHFAEIIKKAVPNTAVITAGRIQSPKTAEEILRKGMADLIGLGRVLFADPLWPKKAAGIIPEPIRRCEPYCSVCTQRALYGRPAFCSQWDFDTRDAFLARVDEMETFLTKIEDRHDP
ncbi:MAG: NADH:flavin oxidoreductase [Syntrophobacteraceae bacterium]|nr:NADH:flavin oxidoreductase [Syntrophobacteraceae bacterium]